MRKDAALSSAFRGITFQLGIRCLNRPLSIQEQVVQLVGIAASGHGFMLTNDPLHDEVGQRLVQRLHPVVSATERHMAGQLGSLSCRMMSLTAPFALTIPNAAT